MEEMENKKKKTSVKLTNVNNLMVGTNARNVILDAPILNDVGEKIQQDPKQEAVEPVSATADSSIGRHHHQKVPQIEHLNLADLNMHEPYPLQEVYNCAKSHAKKKVSITDEKLGNKHSKDNTQVSMLDGNVYRSKTKYSSADSMKQNTKTAEQKYPSTNLPARSMHSGNDSNERTGQQVLDFRDIQHSTNKDSTSSKDDKDDNGDGDGFGNDDDDDDDELEGEKMDIDEGSGMSNVHMIGENQLNLQFGHRLVRSHTLDGNTRVRLRYRRIKHRSDVADGNRRGDCMEITLRIHPFPEAEAAAVEELNRDESLCSKITAAFSNFGTTFLGFRFGSIVIELRPDSKDSLHQIIKALENGEFDDIILDILKHKSVFQLIKGKEITVDVDFDVSEECLDDVSGSEELKSKLRDSSGKQSFGISVHVKDMESGKEEVVKGHRRQESANDMTMRQLLKNVLLLTEEEVKLKEACATYLRKMADEVKRTDVKNTRTAFLSGGIVGGLLAGVGAALAPVTVGTSLLLGVAGVAVASIFMAVETKEKETKIVDSVVDQKTLKKCQAKLDEYQKTVSELVSLLQQVMVTAIYFQNPLLEEPTDMDPKQLNRLKILLTKLEKGSYETNSHVKDGGIMVERFQRSLRPVTIGRTEASVISESLNLRELITLSVKKRKTSPHDIPEELQKLAARLENYHFTETPTTLLHIKESRSISKTDIRGLYSTQRDSKLARKRP